MTHSPVLDLRGVSKRFQAPQTMLDKIAQRLRVERRPAVHAVDGVDLTVGQGEVLGLVGESGCGKSTLGRIAAGLLQPTEGTIVRGPALDDRPLATQMIFQDPMSSLNPRMRVRDIIGEAPLVHGLVSRGMLDSYVERFMRSAGIDPAFKHRFPHQFSGGQRQRIGIARALAVKPEMLICDESVAALDVSIQAQILNLFMELKEQMGLTFLFISHDLGVIQHVSDRVAVMYLGRVVEQAPVQELFRQANHPYTTSLLTSIPRLDSRKRSFVTVKGEIPSPLRPPSGCHFHPRCPHAMERCSVERPPLVDIGAEHLSACHLNEAL